MKFGTLSRLQSQFIRNGFQSLTIMDAKISGVGPKLKERLVQNGIENAAQVSAERLANIPGFGESKVTSVVEWRRVVEID